MHPQDIFVGLAAGAVGGYFLLGALFDAAWLMNLPKPRLLAESLGRTPARVVLAALGLVVMAIGWLIASGWRFHWS
jgi:Immunity protein 17